MPNDFQEKFGTLEAELLTVKEENKLMKQNFLNLISASNNSNRDSRNQSASSNEPSAPSDKPSKPCLKLYPSSPDSGKSMEVIVGSSRTSLNLSDSLGRPSFQNPSPGREGPSFEELSSYSRGNYLGNSFEFSRGSQRKLDFGDQSIERERERSSNSQGRGTKESDVFDGRKNDPQKRHSDSNFDYSRERSENQNTNREGIRDRSKSAERRVVIDEKKNSYKNYSDGEFNYSQEHSESREANRERDREKNSDRSGDTKRKLGYDESRANSHENYRSDGREISRERPESRVTSREREGSSNKGNSSDQSSRTDDSFEGRPSRRTNSSRDLNRDLSDEEDRDRRGQDDRSRRSSFPSRSPYRTEGEKRRRADLKLDKFDGRGPLEVFFYQFDNCSEHNEWDESEKLSQLKGALKDAAAQIMMGDQGEGWTYEQLRGELQKCFGLEGHKSQYRNQLKIRRRQKGESLRALYQDVSHLLLLAHPGRKNETRDDISVDAFIDTLNDYELERSVKDRFPKDLAGAFQIALDLEANRKSLHHGEDRRDRGKNFRTDVEARAVSQDIDWRERVVALENLAENQARQIRPDTGVRVVAREPEWKERCDALERSVAEVKKITQQKEEGKLTELETKMKELQLQTRPRGQETVQNFPSGWAQGWGTVNSPNHDPYRAAQAVSQAVSPSQIVNPSNSWPPPDSNYATHPSPPKDLCFICGGSDHYSPSCPQRPCDRCKQPGHQRPECKNLAVCWNCGQPGHRKVDCRSRRTSGARVLSDSNGTRDARANMVRSRESLVGEVHQSHDREVYLEMECKGVKRMFLLDSGCDLTMVPTSYVRGASLLSTEQKVRAANGTAIDLKGKISMMLKLGNLRIPTVALVSDHITEGLIGNDWLVKNDVCWGFGLGVIRLREQNFAMTKRKGNAVACRVVAQGSMKVPPNSEILVRSKLMFQRAGESAPSRKSYNAVLEPRELARGVYVAGVVLPSRCSNLPTRIVNTTDKAYRLKSEELLGEAQPGEVVGSEESDTPVTDEWLDKIVDEVDVSVNTEEKGRLRDILQRYRDCFSQHEFDLGRTSVVTHQIDTGNSRPVKQVLRRHPPPHQEEIDRQLKSMSEQDIIEPSKSPWASNVVIVKKKDGAMRFCIDYRQLNDVTVKDSYPLPKIVDCLDALSKGKFFSAFDLRSGYFQVSMDERDKEKTSFVTRSGLFQFKVLPFGVTNGPATFQRLMDLTMAGLNYGILLVYLDDIILMSSTVSEHLDRLVMMLDRLRTAGLKLKPSKCNLLRRKIHFLGHVVSDQGVSTDPEKVETVRDWPVPCNITDVRAFIGLCSYYRRFVRNFAEIAGPLHALTGKRASFH